MGDKFLEKHSKERSIESLGVLVIDDDVDILALVETLLRNMGITKIICASDGTVGLSHIYVPTVTIDLVICDWNMPHMSGLDVLQKVKKDFPEIAFAMLTVKTQENAMIAARRSGVDMYITKPIESSSFQKKIRLMAERIFALNR